MGVIRFGGVGVVGIVLLLSVGRILFDEYFFPDVESEKTETIHFETEVQPSSPLFLYDEVKKEYNFGRWREVCSFVYDF